MNNQSEFSLLQERMCKGAAFDQILKNGEAYVYPHRRADIIGKARARWDSALDSNNVIAILNTWLWHGMIFTVNGAYYRDSDEKGEVFYFNYDDIASLDVATNGNSLSMIFSNHECRINKNYYYYDMYALKDTLEFLRDFALRDIEVIQPRSTGWLRNPWMSQKQLDECSVIIHSAALAGNSSNLIEDLAHVFGVSMDAPAARALERNLASATQVRAGISNALVGWPAPAQQLINVTTKSGMIEAMGWLAVSHFLKYST